MKVVYLLIVSALCACSSQTAAKGEIFTTYEQIQKDFQANGLLADQKYKDKIITFPVALKSVVRGIGGLNVVAFSGSRAISAVFKNESENVLKELHQGDSFKMKCNTVFKGIVFDDCIAIK